MYWIIFTLIIYRNIGHHLYSDVANAHFSNAYQQLNLLPRTKHYLMLQSKTKPSAIPTSLLPAWVSCNFTWLHPLKPLIVSMSKECGITINKQVPEKIEWYSQPIPENTTHTKSADEFTKNKILRNSTQGSAANKLYCAKWIIKGKIINTLSCHCLPVCLFIYWSAWYNNIQ